MVGVVAVVVGSELVGRFVFGVSLLGIAVVSWEAHKLTTTVGEKFYTLTSGAKNITGNAINSVKDYWGNLTHSNNQNETDQTSGQNEGQDSQTNAGAEGSYWGNFSWYDITDGARSVLSKIGQLIIGPDPRSLCCF